MSAAAFSMSHSTETSAEVPAGESRWTDPIDLTVYHGDHIVIDLHLPQPTPTRQLLGSGSTDRCRETSSDRTSFHVEGRHRKPSTNRGCSRP